MKIAFKDFKAGSGVDVFIQNLSQGIAVQGENISITLYPSYYQYIPSLLRLKKEKMDDSLVIHSNINNGYVFKNHIPLVVTEHNMLHDPSMDRYASLVQKIYYWRIYQREKKSLKVADAVTCVSRYTKMMLEKAYGYFDSKVIYNGIDTDVFKPAEVKKGAYGIDQKKTVLLYVGNQSRRKGTDLLPKIMDRLGDDYLLLMTSGLRNDVKGHRKNIRVVGRVNRKELVDLYNICDIFLFPSRLEGFGLSVAEAMACGKPVVATDYSSLPELIMDGRGGFLCKMDDVSDFAEKVEMLAKDENLRKKAGIYNRKIVLEKFGQEKMASEYIKLYKSII